MPEETTLEKFHRIMDFLIEESAMDYGLDEVKEDINNMRGEVNEVLQRGTLKENKNDNA